MLQLLLLVCFVGVAWGQYTANWTSLDARPLPLWYDQSKFGIFIHWSTFSVPSFKNEWYWYNLDTTKDPQTVAFHDRVYGPNFTYPQFGPMFTCEMFNPDNWADMFLASGAKYVVLTSKHHDGFCNWPSANSWNWNSKDTGPHQDNVGLLTAAVRSRGLVMGLYFSQFEWYNPLFLQDKANNGATRYYQQSVSYPQMLDIVNTYQPEVIWSDGDWEMPDTYWGSQDFLAWLYNESPVKDSVVVNDRWGQGDACKHGGYFTCSDRYNPGTLQNHKWENALTLDLTSWGYNRLSALSNYMTIQQLLFELSSTVACGGNMLLNVGPTADGRILPIFEERLRQIGSWLGINGESIYNTTPWRVQNETANQVWYTSNQQAVYAIALAWPANQQLVLISPKATSSSVVTILGSEQIKLGVTPGANGGITIDLPEDTVNPSLLVSQWAWVFKLTNVS